MHFFTMKQYSANAQGIGHYYGTFVFNPLHLPLVSGEKYPVYLPGCARLTFRKRSTVKLASTNHWRVKRYSLNAEWQIWSIIVDFLCNLRRFVLLSNDLCLPIWQWCSIKGPYCYPGQFWVNVWWYGGKLQFIRCRFCRSRFYGTGYAFHSIHKI